MSFVSVYITASSKAEARKIAVSLVQKKLVACANIFPTVESVYRWKGKVEHSEESVIIAKTNKKNMKKIITLVKSLHSYDNPCIVSLPIQSGNPKFLKWLKEYANSP